MPSYQRYDSGRAEFYSETPTSPPNVMSALVFDLVDQISQIDFGSSDVVRIDVVLNLGQGQSQQVCFWFVDAT
jgi:hypothetical protein